MKNPDFYSDKYKKYKEQYKNYYILHKKEINIQRGKQLRKNWVLYTLKRIKQKCKRENIKFNLTIDDINLPIYCPILGIKLKIGKNPVYNSPSLDRIDNSKGYIKNNVQVISFSANVMKSDMPINVWKKIFKRFKDKD